MKTKAYLIISAMIFLMAGITIAQPRFPRDGEEGPGRQRLERFRRMRLIEILKLSEEDAVRFFAKQSAHEDAVRDLMKSRNEALDEMKKLMQDNKGDGADLQKREDKVLDIDQKIFAERQRFQADVRKLLSVEQFAKFLVFEQNFGRQMRDALEEMHKGDRHRDN